MGRSQCEILLQLWLVLTGLRPSDLSVTVGTPRGHPDKLACLNNLGNSFTRFERLGELSDLEDAISMPRDAVDLTPRGRTDGPARLNNLGNSVTRFECLGRGESAMRGSVSWESLLPTLWHSMVKSVLDALAFSVRHVVSLEFIPDPIICLATESWGPTTHFRGSDWL